jgi:hypothetical protein
MTVQQKNINHLKPITVRILFSFLLLCTCFLGNAQQASVTAYPGPAGIESSKKFQVLVNGRPSFVYVAPVFFELNNPNRTNAFTQFDFSGKIKVEVIVNRTDIQSVRIRPASSSIKYQRTGNRISFELNEPKKLSVEINGEIDDNLVIFANKPDVSIPASNGKDVAYFKGGKIDASSLNGKKVLYFAPGVHYVDGEYGFLRLKSNQTLYLAGGAVLRARVEAANAQNIKIRGRGIIDGSTLLGRIPDYYKSFLGEPDSVQRPFFVHFQNCKNVEVDGVILNNSPFWTLVFSSCSDVVVNNVKEFGYVDNSDGIDVVGSKNVSINDVFLRINDDCIALKGMPDDVENVSVTNSIMWSDRACGLQIGHETLMKSISKVRFSNIDILEQRNRYIGHYAMGIFNGDSATVSEVSFENIRVENCERLISLIVQKGFYNKSPIRGRIENIRFKNIYSYKTADIHLDGSDENHGVRNVTFENIYLNNQAAEPEIFANPYVYYIVFKQDGKISKTIASPIATGTKYTPVDLTPWGNRSRTDAVAGDGKGWLDLGPEEDMAEVKGGTQILTGIPFSISGDTEKGAIVLRSSQYLTSQPYASYPININQKLDYLFFLQATAFTNSFVDKAPPVVWIGPAGKLMFDQSPVGTALWYYTVRYKEDGSEVKVPVKAGWNVEDWGIWAPGGWVTVLNGRKFYIQQWTNPYPDKTIESVKMYSSLQPEVPVLLSLTIGKK